MNYEEEIIDGVKTLTAEHKLDCEKQLNEFMTDDDYDIVVDDDMDFYGPATATIFGSENSEDNLGFRFTSRATVTGSFRGRKKLCGRLKNHVSMVRLLKIS